VADWVGLDTGKEANNRLFWQGVQKSFESQDEDDKKFLCRW